MTLNPDRLRLAVAFVALKFKPPNQTFSSYVLDLRAKFPPSRSEISAEMLWHNRALLLERDYAMLQEKLEAEQIKSLALASAAPSVPLIAPNSSFEQSIQSKKKQKRKAEVLARPEKLPNSQPSRLDLQSLLDGLQGHSCAGMEIPTIPGPRSLFSALNDVMQLKALSNVRLGLLFSVTARSMESAAELLESMLRPVASNTLSDPSTLNTLGLVLHHTLSDVILSLARTWSSQSTGEPEPNELIVSLLEKTTTRVLYPLIRAFKPKSEAFLMALLDVPTGGGDATRSMAENEKPPGNLPAHATLPTDIRADMLSLFRTAFCLLDSQLRFMALVPKLCLAAHTLRCSLILETIRELRRLLATQPTKGSSSVPTGGAVTGDKQTHATGRLAGRVKRLATKDTLSYLCTILHVLFNEPASRVSTTIPDPSRCANGTDTEKSAEAEWESDVPSRDERLLSEGVSEALFSLVTRCKRTTSSSQIHQTQTRSVTESAQREMSSGRGASTERHDRTIGGDASGSGKSHEELCSGGHDALEDTVADVVADRELGVNVSAAGLVNTDNGREEQAVSMPQSQSPSELWNGYRDDDMFELDEVGYGMLLGTVERYWVWSKS